MTKTTRDIPMNEGATVADRLKAARMDAGMTRKALEKTTGIPYSSIEKYERGDMDPGTARLQNICEKLDVSVNWILNGDEVSSVAEPPKPAETQPSANVAENSTEDDTESAPESMANDIITLLFELDGLRTAGFEGSRRRAMALVKETLSLMKYLEPDEMIEVIKTRRLHEEECPSMDFLVELFEENHEEAQRYCGNIEERLIDTAILGIDLFSLENKALFKVAKQNGVESPDPFDLWDEWGDHEEFVPNMRSVFWSLAFTGKGVDFLDEEAFPRREISAQKDEDEDSEELCGIGMF